MANIDTYLKLGWKVVHEGDDYITLEKRKFSVLWFLFWLIMGGIGAIFYLIYHFCFKKPVKRTIKKSETKK